MIDDPLESGYSSTGTASTPTGNERTSQRLSQQAHVAVDRVGQALGSTTDKVMELQQQYGDKAREQVRANPLAAVGIAAAVGLVISKLFMR